MLINRLRDLDKNAVSFDVETWLIRAGNLTPPLVLGSLAKLVGGEVRGELLSKDDTLRAFATIMEDPSLVLCGANIAYDIGIMVSEFAKRGIDVMPHVYKALMGEHTRHMPAVHDGRVYDLQHAETLHAIAGGHLGKDPRTGGPLKGRYSLDQCVDLNLGRKDAKVNDIYRKRYAEFDGVPLDQLPKEAAQYPVDDAVNTHETTLAQSGHLPKISPSHVWGPQGACLDCGATSIGGTCVVTRPHANMHDLASQTATAVNLHFASAWGFAIDQSTVDVIENHSARAHREGLAPFVEAELVRKDGSEDRSRLKRMVAQAYGAKGVCPTCKGTGKVPSPANARSKIICFEMAEDGETRKKTCDGTGLILGQEVPRSEKEGIAYGRSILFESGDEFLMDYAAYIEDAKILNVYVPYLRTGRVCVSCERHGTSGEDAHVEGCVMAGWKDIPLTLKPNAILDTGRVSYGGAVMLLPRKAGYVDDKTKEYVPSLREAFVPRPGCVFSSEDFTSGEMYTHAQSCIWLLGFSDLGSALLNKVNPHKALAATVLGISYEECLRRDKEYLVKAAIQSCKPFNFGRPTGMSAQKIVLSQRSQGPDTPTADGPSRISDGKGGKIRGYKGLRFCVLMNGSPTCGDVKVTKWGRRDQPIPPTCKACLECADHLSNMWTRQWSENQPYFELVDTYLNDGMVITREMLERWPWLKDIYQPNQRLEPGQIMQHWSGRLRGGLTYTSLANGFFQGLLADVAKLAYRLVARECYDSSVTVPDMLYENSLVSPYAGAQSPLYGSRPILFAHDEIIAEHQLSVAHDAATRISEIMRDCMRFVCPDVARTAGASPTLMSRWYKGAEEIRDADGRLLVWDPSYQKK